MQTRWLFKEIYFMCMGVCLHVSTCTTYVQCPERLEEVIVALGTAVTDRCELPHGSWEWNLGPLEKQTILLTTKPYLQSRERGFLKVFYRTLRIKWTEMRMGKKGL